MKKSSGLMNRSLFCIPFLLLCRMVLYCQADSVKQEPYVYFNAFSVITGFSLSEYQSHDVDYFKMLAPNSSIIKDIPATVEKRTMSNNSGNARINFGLNVHLKTKDFKTKLTTFSSEWRMGLNISSNFRERYSCSKQTTLYTDTFYSDYTSMVIYEDVKTDRAYQFTYRSNNAYFDLTKTYHTDQKKWISFYTGINFGIGYTYNNFIDVRSAVDTSNNSRLKENYYRLDLYYAINRENIKLKSELFYNASIPFGVILRPTIKTKRHTYRLSFFTEGRVGYRWQKNYTNTYTKTPLGTVQIGFKYYFKK